MKDVIAGVGTVLLAGGLVYGFIRGFVTQEQLAVAVVALGLPSPVALIKKLLAGKPE